VPADELLDSWNDLFNNLAARCVPRRTVSAAPRLQKSWWRPELKAPIMARYKAQRAHRQARTAASKAALVEAHKTARDAIANAKRASIVQLAKDLGSAPPGRFWQMYRSEWMDGWI
jgi:hypothetical protein